MSTFQRLTLIGLYNYEQQYERDLFSALTLPAGYDKPTFVNSLLLEHGEKCVMYTDPDFMRSAIGIWSGKWQLELSRIFEALTAEYNPIYNYDRYEESDDGRGKSYTSKVTGGATTSSQTDEGRAGESTSIADTSLDSSSELTSSSAEESENKHKAKDTPKYDVTNEQITSANNEHQVSADNSSSYQPESKDILNSGKTKTNTDGATQDLDETTNTTANMSNAENNSTTQTGNTNTTTANSENASTSTHGETTNTNNVEDSETETNSHRAHLFGNIGVTTSAAMVNEVVLQRMNKNLYEIATGLFANELLIGLW